MTHLNELFLRLCIFALLLISTDAQLLSTMQGIWTTLGGSPQYWRGTQICNSTDFIGVTCDPSKSWPVQIVLPSRSLTGTIPSSIENLVNLTSLDLSANQLTGTIPSSIGNITSRLLIHLDLSSNRLTGTIPGTLFVSSSTLSYINLSQNQLSGTLPPFGNLTSVNLLALNTNSLSGIIHPSIGQLRSLSTLILYQNRFTGPIPPLFNTSLRQIEFDRNQLSGSISPSMMDLPNLQMLHLQTNQLSGVLPARNSSLSPISKLDVSGNAITSTSGYIFASSTCSLSNNPLRTCLVNISAACSYTAGPCTSDPSSLDSMRDVWTSIGGPPSLWNGSYICNSTDFIGVVCDATLTWPVQINLSNRSLYGSISASIGRLINLTALDISSNAIVGSMPSSMCNLTLLTSLNASINQLSGTLPPCVSTLNRLQSIDVSTNRLSGTISTSIGNMSSLRYLSLSNNSLTGPIPTSIGSSSLLTSLYLSYNRLSGSIPQSVMNLANLQYFHLQFNSLGGNVPGRDGNLALLIQFDARSNNLTSVEGYLDTMDVCDLGGNPFPCDPPLDVSVNCYYQCINTITTTTWISSPAWTGQTSTESQTSSIMVQISREAQKLTETQASSEPQISSVQRSTVQTSTVQRSTVQRSTVQRSTVQRSTVQTSTVQTTTETQPTTKQSSIDVNQLYDNNTKISVSQARDVLNEGLNKSVGLESVNLISAVISSILRNNTSSFVYTTVNASINLQTYDIVDVRSISSHIVDSTIGVTVPASIVESSTRVSVALSSLNFNPFRSIANDSIYSGVTGVTLYDDKGREIYVRSSNELINISMGIIRAIPDDHYAVCQYWNELETNHLTNFSIGIERIKSIGGDEVESKEGGDHKMLIIIVCCAAGGFIVLLSFDLKSEGDMNGKLEWLQVVSDEKKTSVWKSLYNGTTTVAVKKIERDNHRLLREATRLKTETTKSMHHPNIVMFMGQNLAEEWIMMEWMNDGSLFSYSSTHSISQFIFQIGRDVSRAMVYLTDLNLVHTALTPQHVFLHVTNDSMLAKVGSLGHAVENGSKWNLSSLFTAPEVIEKKRQYISADVWSFGLLLQFIAADGKCEEKQKSKRISSVQVETKWDTSIRGLIQDCTDTDAERRPSFSDIAQRMERRGALSGIEPEALPP
ncbi:putative LRR receptor-like serine/threonine-protein kinase [Planoprotostelium fungivorum]|uniref:Putative LRR receptor-like serine/threonine-protein kinase n=1 Tax=Planoprotostelium fungivorum TaxID=1890364 RepID=A0A2P6NXJ9_9EUKA|nr:putative LRR receptor-like serine/threonine-protein kinase [Planoprotostelium fungivorum]